LVGTNGKWTGGDYLIRKIDFGTGADLITRSAAFRKTLAITSKLQDILKWAKGQLDAGNISLELYQYFEQLMDQSWFKNYNADAVALFNWRYNRLKYLVNNGKTTPQLFWGGLNRLMQRIAQ